MGAFQFFNQVTEVLRVEFGLALHGQSAHVLQERGEKVLRQLKSQAIQRVPKRPAARVPADHQAGPFQPHLFGGKRLVGLSVQQHGAAVDAGFVPEN